jgi:energy-coupling factor transporter ATP-binding protein EcfA2
MITKLVITDNKNTPIHYLSDVFKNKKTFIFKGGVNVMIGGNGCGKSTIMKLLYEYTLCTESYYSEMPNMIVTLTDMFDDKTNELKDGANIYCDYAGKVFRLRPSVEITDTEAQYSVGLFVSKFNHHRSSMGESSKESIARLFETMFDGKVSYNFPLKDLVDKIENANCVWSERLKNLLNYYKNNKIEVSDKDYEYTVLMDEPDRNLDINGIEELYNILSERKSMTQIISVIHNPILIYKLSKCKDVNIIEVEKGYLNKVKSLVESCI